MQTYKGWKIIQLCISSEELSCEGRGEWQKKGGIFVCFFSDGRDTGIFIGKNQGKRLRDDDNDDMVSGLKINFPVVCWKQPG